MIGRLCMGVAGLTVLIGSVGYAQNQPPGGPPDFAQMRQQMMERLKDALGAADDEWKVMEPKIEKIQQLQRQTGGRGPGMFGPGPGGPGGPGGPDQANAGPSAGGQGGPPPGGPDAGFAQPQQPQSEIQQRQGELREALQANASPDEVKAKIAALRDARTKAKANLAQAQEELRQVLSLRQEAVLVTFGILD